MLKTGMVNEGIEVENTFKHYYAEVPKKFVLDIKNIPLILVKCLICVLLSKTICS